MVRLIPTLAVAIVLISAGSGASALAAIIFGDNFGGPHPGAWSIGHVGGAGPYAWAWPNGYAHPYMDPAGVEDLCADVVPPANPGEFCYVDNLDVFMERRNVSLSGFDNATLSFDYIVDTENTFDFFTVDVRDQSGSWHEMFRESGTTVPLLFTLKQIDLSQFAGQTGLYVRFHFFSDSSVSGGPYDGVRVDNVSLAAESSALADLTPYQPAGWDDKIVVSTVPGTSSDGSAFFVDQQLYIDRAWINSGDGDAGAFRTSLFIDGVERSFSIGSLAAGLSSSVSDSEWTFTTAGCHSLKLVVDVNDDIGEANESNNEYERQIFVEGANDPLYSNQWHLRNTGQGGGTAGQDVNVQSVWNTYRGSPNEIIAIIDNGVEVGHEDFCPSIVPNLSHDYVDGDGDPSPTQANENQGTSAAGVAAARGFNDLGGRGSAPGAGIVGYRLLGNATVANIIDAWTRNRGQVDVYNNSWGLDQPYGQVLWAMTPEQEDAVALGATSGRGGRGSIYVKSGGDGGDAGNANYNEFGNSRFVSTVAATNHDGERSAYSHRGANLRLNAPSSGSLAITTTDRTGAAGSDPGNYTATFGGTASSSALVSGIVALMLQANPNLGWRDVQMILMTTAEENDPTDPDWTNNAAGFPVNHNYGFGRVDAQAAVNAAINWQTLPAEVGVASSLRNPNLPIPDNDSNGVSDSVQFTEAINIEFVEIYFSASDHTWWGDLEIELESPGGTTSLLAEQHNNGFLPST